MDLNKIAEINACIGRIQETKQMIYDLQQIQSQPYMYTLMYKGEARGTDLYVTYSIGEAFKEVTHHLVGHYQHLLGQLYNQAATLGIDGVEEIKHVEKVKYRD